MASEYYKPCKELDQCEQLIRLYWETKQYELCFQGHLEIAETGYALAECQVGYFYWEGIGTEKDLDKAFFWIRRGAEHGDRDAQFNLGYFYENGIGILKDTEEAKAWYKKAAMQGHTLAIEKMRNDLQ